MNRAPGHRIEESIKRGHPVSFRFDGAPIAAYSGETIAAALIASGIPATRLSRRSMPRGYYCGMGVCWECLVTVNHKPNQRACMTVVKDGMVVQTATAPDST